MSLVEYEERLVFEAYPQRGDYSSDSSCTGLGCGTEGAGNAKKEPLEKMLSLTVASGSHHSPTMRPLQRFLTLLIALFMLLAIAPLPSLAASSAAIRAYDDAETISRDYSGQSLVREEFSGAKLQGANFSGADLQGAVFNGSDLAGANLHGVNLSNGITYLTNLTDVNLSDAILTSAMMLKSIFRNANVTGADFSFALLDRTQVLQLCKTASGTNPVTGVDTRESLGCS